MDELPETIEVGLALMLTTGTGAGVTTTFTTAVADAPPAAVATAEYSVDMVGLTDIVPPVAGKVYKMPFAPVTTTSGGVGSGHR